MKEMVGLTPGHRVLGREASLKIFNEQAVRNTIVKDSESKK